MSSNQGLLYFLSKEVEHTIQALYIMYIQLHLLWIIPQRGKSIKCYEAQALIKNMPLWNYQSFNLVIESDVNHQHLPSNADPAGATWVVGVHTASEPHLQTDTDISTRMKSCYSRVLQPLRVSIYLVVFGDHPDHTHSNGHVKRFHLLSWWFHLDPRCAWYKKNMICLPTQSRDQISAWRAVAISCSVSCVL